MNIILTSYAYDEKLQTSANLAKEKSMDIYLKNSYVCLKSAKLNNPQDSIVFVTNVDIPEFYNKIFKQAGIEIITIQFNSFLMPENVKWGLAYFKLCALKYCSQYLEFENIALVDNDSLIINNFNDIWEEAKNNILLYNVFHWYSNKNEDIFRKEMSEILSAKNVVHMGGEFICTNKRMLSDFLYECEKVWGIMESKNRYTTRGDEYILSAVANKFWERVLSANAYVQRMWTGEGYYYTSTNCYCSPVSVLHVPDEKNRGMLKLFSLYYRSNNVEKKRIYRILRLPKVRKKSIIEKIITKIKR